MTLSLFSWLLIVTLARDRGYTGCTNVTLKLKKECFGIITMPFIAQTNSSGMAVNCFVTMRKLGLETT